MTETSRWHLWTVVAVLLFLGKAGYAQGYVVSPTVPDFTDITAACVEATYGTTGNPFTTKGIVSNRHSLITRQGTDPNTGNQLKFLPSGETKVIRLGNDSIGGQAESITYHFKVDPEKSVLFLKFAVVFQDPGHPGKDQPRFVVRIMNSEGALIESCAEYDVSARAEIEGFKSFEMFGVPVRWRDWTNVGLDMSSYAGQEVQVQFVTYDCALMGHFGYAYFTASCISSQLMLSACAGDGFTLSAPEGFSSYLWQDGRTTSSTRWTRTEETMHVSCEITSATGCRFTLSALVADDPHLPPTPVFYDTICQGDPYTKHNYDLPPQQDIGTSPYYNTYFDLSDCGKSGETTLFLTVLQRYYPIGARICEGDDYTDNGFSYLNARAGKYYDTLTYSRTDRCDSIVVLQLDVYPLVAMTEDIVGEQHPCVGSVQHYNMRENWPEGSYTWEFPEGYTILSGQGQPEVVVQVTDIAVTGQVILLYGTGGCALGTNPLIIEPGRTYWQTVPDTVCTGVEYHKQGFHVPAQDSAGVYSYVQHNTTVGGCDSIITLNLHVYPTPDVNIIASDYLICAGDSVRLEALAGQAQLIPPDPPAIAVGDVLCEDGSILKIGEYNPGIHRAAGIVYWLNKTGKHGWAVSLEDAASGGNDLFFWLRSGYMIDIPGIRNYYLSIEASADTSGYNNTRAMRSVTDSRYYIPAAWAVDFEHGWYIPAAGQLTMLFSAIEDINESFRKVTGAPFLTALSGYKRYWSSSESSARQAWNLALWLGYISVNERDSYYNIRAVKSF